MVTMTAAATEKVHDFIQEHGVETGAGLRVAVLPGGCSGFQYGLNIEDTPEFKSHGEIGSVQFTMDLLAAAKEFTFDPENRNDPFRIPREKVSDEEGEGDTHPQGCSDRPKHRKNSLQYHSAPLRRTGADHGSRSAPRRDVDKNC